MTRDNTVIKKAIIYSEKGSNEANELENKIQAEVGGYSVSDNSDNGKTYTITMPIINVSKYKKILARLFSLF
ncbi:hypothetical protein [endosymbiont GvMRE of Glomus versiforme]|uniref:hypothetical protein n=1 Tax=endosymbiont GvMRE of Glomus versiforme TaxID=2039283 RepID=UPI0011C3505C|nr:hypothetical protein [endosymbiont GvMRE of Glomus versiforme]